MLNEILSKTTFFLRYLAILQMLKQFSHFDFKPIASDIHLDKAVLLDNTLDSE